MYGGFSSFKTVEKRVEKEEEGVVLLYLENTRQL